MAHILCITGGLSGMLHSSLELMRRLEAQGHRVTAASRAAVAETAASHGIAFRRLPESTYHEFLAEDRHRGPLERWRTLRARRQAALGTLGLQELERLVASEEPDLVLLDAELHEEMLVLRALGTPTALLNSFVSIWRRRGLPPPHHLVVPGRGILGNSLGIELLWQQLFLRKLWRRWRQRLTLVGCDRVSLLETIARRRGLNPWEEMDARQWLMPVAARRMPTLTLHALEFELPHMPPSTVRYVGPMVADQRPVAPQHEAEAARVRDLLRSRKGSGRQLIYAGFGASFTAAPDLIERLESAVSQRPDWDLITSLAGRAAGGAEELAAVRHPHLHRFSWVPQLEVLSHADLAVVHGGTNTADECVLHGVPLLVYCGHQTDMAGTAARIAFHGLGIVGRSSDGPDEMIRHLETLLDPSTGYAKRVHEMRERYLAYRREQIVERTIDRLLAQPPSW